VNETLVANRYRLERVLGRGGMAVVHVAEDGELGRRVAVKILSEQVAGDGEIRKRFLREARLAARLSHQNIVALYDAGEDEGRLYIVMELVNGEPVDQLLAREGRLPAERVVALGRQACAALEHAHSAGLVHRDVKPHNLLVRDDGLLKLTDFGIARAVGLERLTQTGTVLGTAAYLAPEQALGEPVTPLADVYSLGVVLYELLAGRPPFAADSLPALAARQHEGSVTPIHEVAPEVPERLDAVVRRCLEPDPARRPASAVELAHELGATIAAEAPTASLPPPSDAPTARLQRARRRPPYVPIALAIVMLAGVGIAAVEVSRDEPASAPAPPARGQTPAQDARNLAEWLRANS
jgi:serine/threonine-protein kinase